jgi:hypothetical protein
MPQHENKEVRPLDSFETKSSLLFGTCHTLWDTWYLENQRYVKHVPDCV